MATKKVNLNEEGSVIVHTDMGFISIAKDVSGNTIVVVNANRIGKKIVIGETSDFSAVIEMKEK